MGDAVGREAGAQPRAGRERELARVGLGQLGDQRLRRREVHAHAPADRGGRDDGDVEPVAGAGELDLPRVGGERDRPVGDVGAQLPAAVERDDARRAPCRSAPTRR